MAVTASEGKLFQILKERRNIFVIPTYQRGYSWDLTNLKEYWQDIYENVVQSDDVHFLGSVITNIHLTESGTTRTDADEYDVIDGQQRILTSVILLRALYDTALMCGYRDAETKIFKKFLFSKAKDASDDEKKVRVSAADERVFNDYVYGHSTPGRREKKNAVLTALEFFRKNLQQCIDVIEEDADRQEFIDSFIERLQDKVVIVYVRTQSDVDAYTVFETLNSKGKDLTPSELLKNYFFSIVSSSRERLNSVKEKWDYVSSDLRDNDVKETDFIRHYWISRHAPVAEKKLYRAIKSSINKNPNEVEQLIAALQDEVRDYLFISKSHEEERTTTALLVSQINDLGIVQCYPLLLSMLRSKLPTTEMTLLLKKVIYTSLRRGVTGKNPNEMENFYSKWAPLLRNEQELPTELIKELDLLDLPEEEFKQYLTTTNINSRFARFVLKRIEDQISTGEHLPLYKVELEHVMPQNPREHADWGVDKESHENLLNNIGNLTLLGKKFNQSISNGPYQIKREKYLESEMKITKQLAKEHKKWDPSAIQSRAEKIYEQLTQVFTD